MSRDVLLALLAGHLTIAACASVPRDHAAETPVQKDSAPSAARAQPVEPPALPWERLPMPGALPSDAGVGPSPAKISDVSLENGLRVVVIEQHRRPVVSIRLRFGAGSASEPAGAIGSTYLAVAQLGDYYEEKGGDELLGEESFRWMVYELGARFDYDVDADASGIGVDGYASDTSRYLELLAQAVIEPRHGVETFAARRDGMIHALEDLQLEDDEAFVRLLGRASFGVRHVYGRSVYGTIADLKALGHEQMAERQDRLLNPRGSTLVIVGDVDTKAVWAAVRRAFARWTAVVAPIRPAPPPPPSIRPGAVIVIPREPATSMAVCGARPLSDVVGSDAALDVLAAILGGGVGSRLVASLREEHALSYSAQAWIIRRRHARALLACTRVGSSDTAAGLERLLEVLRAMEANPPSAEELARGKALVRAELEARFEDVGSTVASVTEALDLGLRLDRSGELEALDRVTAEEIHTLAKQVLAPKGLQFLLSGDPRQAKQAVTANKLGKVEVVRSVR